MSLTASSIATTNTLEQLRTEFNNLVTDVTGLEAGTKTFSAVTSNTSNTTTLNVLEDGTIIFEGATDDGNETTLTVVDPTAYCTITFPSSVAPSKIIVPSSKTFKVVVLVSVAVIDENALVPVSKPSTSETRLLN